MTTNTNLASASVNEVLRMAPASAPVFNQLGVDTCCGGGLPLDQAAREAGIPLDELLQALAPVLPPAAREAAS